MRDVVAYLLTSVDGRVDDPQHWVFDTIDAELYAYLTSLIAAQDAVLLGRKTYDQWQHDWPDSDHEPFASFINGAPKYVASSTLRDPAWRNTTVVADIGATIAELKRAPGKSIGVHGSIELVRSLVREGLLDELRLAVFPAIAGRGRVLFDELDVHRLALVDVERTGTGIVFLTYRVSDAAPRAAPRKPLDLFAGIPVRDYAAALPWYERLLGAPPSFLATPTEAVWQLADHRWVYVVERPERAGHAMHTLLVDDLDACVAAIRARGLEPHATDEYPNGMRKVTFRDPDGNELGFGGTSV